MAASDARRTEPNQGTASDAGVRLSPVPSALPSGATDAELHRAIGALSLLVRAVLGAGDPGPEAPGDAVRATGTPATGSGGVGTGVPTPPTAIRPHRAPATMLVPVEAAAASELQVWAERLEIPASELLRTAMRRLLDDLAGTHDWRPGGSATA